MQHCLRSIYQEKRNAVKRCTYSVFGVFLCWLCECSLLIFIGKKTSIKLVVLFNLLPYLPNVPGSDIERLTQ